MPRYIVSPRHDRSRVSSWLAIVALVLAVAALFGPAPANGITVWAVVAGVLAIVARLIERRPR